MRLFLVLLIALTMGGCVVSGEVDGNESASSNGEFRTREEIVDQAAYNIMFLQSGPAYVHSYDASPPIRSFMGRIFDGCHAQNVIHWGNYNDAPNYRDHTPDVWFTSDGPSSETEWTRVVSNAARPAHDRLLNLCFERMMDGFKQTIRYEYAAQGRSAAAAEERILNAVLAGSTATVRALGILSTTRSLKLEITMESPSTDKDLVDGNGLSFRERVDALNQKQKALALEAKLATFEVFSGPLGVLAYAGFLADATPIGHETVSLMGFGTTYNKAEIMGIVDKAIAAGVDWNRKDVSKWNDYVQSCALGDVEQQAQLAYIASKTGSSYTKDPEKAQKAEDPPLGSEQDRGPNKFEGYPEYGQQGGWAARSGLGHGQAPRAVYSVHPNGRGTNNGCGGACR